MCAHPYALNFMLVMNTLQHLHCSPPHTRTPFSLVCDSALTIFWQHLPLSSFMLTSLCVCLMAFVSWLMHYIAKTCGCILGAKFGTKEMLSSITFCSYCRGELHSPTSAVHACRQQSEPTFAALQACKVPVTHQVYHTISHVGFATDWPWRKPKVCALAWSCF